MEKKEKNKGLKKFAPIIICLIVVLCLIGIILFLNSKSHKYAVATKYLNDNNYVEAMRVYKNIKEYKDSKNKIIECMYKQSKFYFRKKHYDKAIKILTEIGDYRDSKQLLEVCKYNYGIYLNSKSMYEESNAYLRDIINYKDSKNYIDKNNKEIEIKQWKNKYTGTFLNTTYSNDKVVISDGTFLSRYLDYSSAKVVINEDFTCDFTDDYSLNCESKLSYSESTAIIKFQDDKLIINYNKYNELSTYEYSKNSNNLIGTEDYKNPEIGMNKEEVLNSKWGSPKKKNKDTFSWGISEQWVYSNNRYIYFEDGIVTSISE